jgi:hypothetical protein
MKLISRLFVAMAVCAIVAASIPAGASCGSPAFITSLCAGGGYLYLSSPGLGSSATLQGDYWALTYGDAPENVHDGGPTPASAFIFGDTPLMYFGGDWADPLASGCPHTTAGVVQPSRTVVSVTDVSADGSTAYAYVGCAEENATGDFSICDAHGGVGNVTVAMQPIPKPVIGSSARAGNDCTFNIDAVTLAPGTANVGAGCTNLVTGYRLWRKVVARDAGDVGGRDPSAGWTQLGGDRLLGTGATDGVNAGVNSDVYYAVQLVYDSGFTSRLLGASSTRAHCGPVVANPGDDFKLIRKPRSIRPNNNN